MRNVFKDFSLEQPAHPVISLIGRGFVMLLGLTLMGLGLWIYAELSGLIAQQTGIREAVWMAIAVVMLFSRADSPLPVPGIISAPVLMAYPLLAVVLLWDARTPLFWVSVFLLAARAITLAITALEGPFPDFARRTPQPPEASV